MPRHLVLGLDSVPANFMFDRFLPRMPHLKALLQRSRYGVLRSTDPPITVPAWAVMFSGMDPGTLGIYGFRHRRRGSYFDMYTPTPQMIQFPCVWQVLSQRGQRVAVIGMPPGYPPPVVNGIYISDFLTPDDAKDYVYPRSMADEIAKVSGGYEFDVTFRVEDRRGVAKELFAMTRKHFAVARHLWAKEKWDFFAVHEIGPDRLHHAFWKYFDPTHPRYVNDSEFGPVADQYYAMLDDEIGQLLAMVPDDVSILVASDHGSMAMDGCFCINEWLLQRGLLKLKSPRPSTTTPLEELEVDWPNTSVWGAGGYYARLFFNLKGRDPQGRLAPGEVPALIARLEQDLAAVRRPDGSPLKPQVLQPSQVYRSVRGDPPDLMVYFGDLRWRSAGTLGHSGLFLSENDTGPDDSVHSFDGFFMLADPRNRQSLKLADQQIIDVGPTLLRRMGIDLPAEVQGRPIPELL
jgi:predicted AlkP superfamily phosphohydrolase/phosphomutase